MLSRRDFLMAMLLAGASVSGCKKRPEPRLVGSSAQRAVREARRFAGTTLNVGSETGPQARELIRFSGPAWERQTGIRINVVELGSPTDAFESIAAEHRAGTAELDCASVAPGWLPDLVELGALAPLDDYIAAYGDPQDAQDLLGHYRALGNWNDRTYGLFDDGDALLLYYRKDLFADRARQAAFAARFGRPLGDPRTYDWQQFLDAALFFTQSGSPALYGMAPLNRDELWSLFQVYLRLNGGRFFDWETMATEVNGPAGIRALEDLTALQKAMPPSFDDISTTPTLATYLSGHAAMAVFWPPLGRWAEGFGVDTPALDGVPSTQIARKTGYALLPGGVTELAVGFVLSVFSRSPHPEAAYLFIQWLNSPEISLQRVMLPDALRDPYRRSHVRSGAYRALWPTAPAYLDLLEKAADVALLDLTLPGAPYYEAAFFVALTNVRLGMAPALALDHMAEELDAITNRLGRGRQRAAYRNFLARPGAMPSRKAAER